MKNAKWSLFLFVVGVILFILSISIYLVLPQNSEPANITLNMIWILFGFINFIFVVLSLFVSKKQSRDTLSALKIYQLNKIVFILITLFYMITIFI